MTDRIKDLSLLLLYLTGWEEDVRNDPGKKQYKSWSGYLFEVLKQLEEENLIRQLYNSKALLVLPEGLEKARHLKDVYLKQAT